MLTFCRTCRKQCGLYRTFDSYRNEMSYESHCCHDSIEDGQGNIYTNTELFAEDRRRSRSMEED